MIHIPAKQEDISDYIKTLQTKDSKKIVTILKLDYSNLPGGEKIEAIIEEVLDKTIKELSIQHLKSYEEETFKIPNKILNRVERLLSDIQLLPLQPGKAIAEQEKFDELKGMILESSRFKEIIKHIISNIHKEGKNTITDIYTSTHALKADIGAFIMQRLSHDKTLGSFFPNIIESLAKQIQTENPTMEASEDIQRFLVGKPTKYINEKHESYLLLQEFRFALDEAFTQEILQFAEENMPLTSDNFAIDINFLKTSVKAANASRRLNSYAYHDMLRNPLGQAQTATNSDNYFRKLPEFKELEIENNFGYVYLTGEQLAKLSIPEDHQGLITITHYNDQYYGVPMGIYYAQRSPEDFEILTQSLEEIKNREKYKDTPFETYFSKLLEYFRPQEWIETKSSTEEVAKHYYEICYETERAWVTCIKYGLKYKFHYVPLHPFEKYKTNSTKDHSIEFCIIEPKYLEMFQKSKERFLTNIEKFLKRITDKQELIDKTIELIEETTIVPIAASISRASPALGQIVPNEDQGKENGVISLMYTSYGQKMHAKQATEEIKEIDPTGEITKAFVACVEDMETFITCYDTRVTTHELNHQTGRNIAKTVGSDHRGLAYANIEEAKATQGLPFILENPEQLTENDIKNLRKTLPFIISKGLLRFTQNHLKNHETNDYLREGALLFDHLLKSGVVEVIGIHIDEEKKITECKNIKDSDFCTIQYNFEETKLQAFMNLCMKFMKEIIPNYYKIQFDPEFKPGTVIPDITSAHFWQYLSRMCYQKDIEHSEEQLNHAHEKIKKIAEPEEASNKVTPEIVQAIIDFTGGKQKKRFIERIAIINKLDIDAPGMNELIEITQELIKKDFPSISH